jgi:hypothetical protein
MSLVKSPEMTEARRAARRANARRSTGPRTARGKDRSRWNALQHGGYATHVAWSDEALKALGEDPVEFETLRQKLLAAEGPSDDPLWTAQIDDLARLYWRRQRIERAWEILGVRQTQAGEPAALVAVLPEGDRLLGQLDAVDRAIDRKTRLLLRLREAEVRHRRELEQSARRRVRQQLDCPDGTPTDEDLALRQAELALLKEHAARLDRQSPYFLDDSEDDDQNPAERSEEVVENTGSAGSTVTSDK